jgi:hypothetical protein
MMDLFLHLKVVTMMMKQQLEEEEVVVGVGVAVE